jgi:hypothetical protein
VVLWTERIIDGWTKRRNGKPEVKFVALRRDGRTATARVSHLVLTAFVGPRPEGMEACHNDGNAENNRVENLRWDTHESNIQDAVRHGTKTDPPVHIGEEHHNSRLTDEQVREILSFTPKLGLNAELSRKYGISQTSIGRIRSGKQRQIRAPQ